MLKKEGEVQRGEGLVTDKNVYIPTLYSIP